jgi:hypothetical protein
MRSCARGISERVAHVISTPTARFSPTGLRTSVRTGPHFADRVDLEESFRSDSLFSPTSATICGQRTLWRAEVVRKSSSGTAFKGSTIEKKYLDCGNITGDIGDTFKEFEAGPLAPSGNFQCYVGSSSTGTLPPASVHVAGSNRPEIASPPLPPAISPATPMPAFPSPRCSLRRRPPFVVTRRHLYQATFAQGRVRKIERLR